jgi:hypothetical protein
VPVSSCYRVSHPVILSAISITIYMGKVSKQLLGFAKFSPHSLEMNATATSFFLTNFSPQNFYSCRNTRCVKNITEMSSCTVDFMFSLLAIFVQLCQYLNIHFNVFATSHYTTQHVLALISIIKCIRCWIEGTFCPVATLFCF